jgi:DNA-directed RNA polymerase subunit RPC12/RpoP
MVLSSGAVGGFEMNCPDCGFKELKTLGIEKSERLGDNCAVLVTAYKCKECGCEFREFMVTHWHLEITQHDPIELMFMEAPV